MFEVLLQLETNLIFIYLFVQDVVSVADLLGWFLGLLDLPPELRDVLLKHTQSSRSVKKQHLCCVCVSQSIPNMEVAAFHQYRDPTEFLALRQK